MKTFDAKLAVRASLCHCNTMAEVKKFLLGLAETVEHFKS